MPGSIDMLLDGLHPEMHGLAYQMYEIGKNISCLTFDLTSPVESYNYLLGLALKVQEIYPDGNFMEGLSKDFCEVLNCTEDMLTEYSILLGIQYRSHIKIIDLASTIDKKGEAIRFVYATNLHMNMIFLEGLGVPTSEVKKELDMLRVSDLPVQRIVLEKAMGLYN